MKNLAHCVCHLIPIPPCRLCVVYRDDARVRAWVDASLLTHHHAEPTPLPCVYLGLTVRGGAAPDLLRDWRECEKGHGTVCVCQCKTGTNCVDFDDGEEETTKEEKIMNSLNLDPIQHDGAMKTVTQITENLAVGSFVHFEKLSSLGWHCLLLANGSPVVESPHLRRPLIDGTGNEFYSVMEAIKFVLDNWKKGDKVAVLCRWGASRAPGIAAAALYASGQQGGVNSAIEFMRKLRREVNAYSETTKEFDIVASFRKSEKSLETYMPHFLDKIYDPIAGMELKNRVPGWQDTEIVSKQHLSALEEMVEICKKPLPDKMKTDYAIFNSGDVVLLVGGGKYWPGIVIAIEQTQKYDPDLNIEVWFRGDSESIDVTDLKSTKNVFFNDIDHISRILKDGRIVGGWEAKLYALTHTAASRVVYLDADAYPVSSLRPLFDSLDVAPFRYWIDMPGTDQHIKWWKVWPSGSNDVPCVQGGQLAIDIRNCWPLVVLTHWLCQHSDFYFSHGFGDQDCWRIALAALNDNKLYRVYAMADWDKVAFVCRYNGIPVVVHRCQGKMFRVEDIPHNWRGMFSAPSYHLPDEVEVFNTFARIEGKNKTCSQSFEDVYKYKIWGEDCGPGSCDEITQQWVDIVNAVIKLTGATSVIDIGCGDGKATVKFNCDNIIGYDCCKSKIDQCANQHGNFPYGKKIAFIHRDATVGQLLVTDLIVCKDVLHHLPNSMIVDMMELIKGSVFNHALFCQDAGQPAEHADCYVGGYRPLSNEMQPLKKFNLTKVCKIGHKEVYLMTNLERIN